MELKLSQQAIKEFKEIFRREFGIMLTDPEAAQRAIKFLKLFKQIYQPIPHQPISHI